MRQSLVEVLQGKRIIPCEEIFKTKTNEKENETKKLMRKEMVLHKDKEMIAKEVYVSLVRHYSIRYLIPLDAKNNLEKIRWMR